MKRTSSSQELSFSHNQGSMYIDAWCIIYCIMCVTAFDKAQLCVNSIFKSWD